VSQPANFLPFFFFLFNDFKVIFNVPPFGCLTTLCDTNLRVINGDIIYNKATAAKGEKCYTWHYIQADSMPEDDTMVRLQRIASALYMMWGKHWH